MSIHTSHSNTHTIRYDTIMSSYHITSHITYTYMPQHASSPWFLFHLLCTWVCDMCLCGMCYCGMCYVVCGMWYVLMYVVLSYCTWFLVVYWDKNQGNEVVTWIHHSHMDYQQDLHITSHNTTHITQYTRHQTPYTTINTHIHLHHPHGHGHGHGHFPFHFQPPV